MKKLTLFIALITTALSTLTAQKCNCCDHAFDQVFNISVGSPFNVNAEAGLAFDHFSYYAGVKVYTTSQVTKDGYSETGLPIAIYGRVDYKLINGNVFRAYLDTYGGYNSNSDFIYGAGVRFGFILNADIMLTLEPAISYEQGNFVTAGVSIRF